MASRRGQDERDDLGDVFGGHYGLVVELLDSVFRVGVGDVVRQLGGHDTWLDERHADVGQQLLRSDSDQPLMPHLVAA